MTVEYEGKKYPCREVHGVIEFGDVIVSVESLENQLIYPGSGSPVSREAEKLDEKIFFYVPDDKINLPEDELKAYVEKSIA